MNVIKTNIDGVVIIEPRIFEDARGYFFESFSQREFDEKVAPIRFVQDNESKSSYGEAGYYKLRRGWLTKDTASNFDYFFADDWVGINFFTDYLLQYDCKKYMGYHCGMLSERDIPESFRLKCNAKKYYTDSYVFPGQENSHMVLDIDKMPISNTYNMGMQVFQIALLKE